uniref:Glutamate--tRNA ligase n=1 Tax=Tetraselmis chuii TaxID=63592 RepID=A0A7S1WZU2_9CHLO
MPVYNFCVAIDDALMGITHVIRAEEHLPNTLRQMLIYEALGFTQPTFAHCSLILAPDRSKLSKRHGATSVGDFRTEGYLSEALVNYLSLLGWNDGTEQEIYTVEELCETFSIDRITKSAAVFDKVKLSWMNGQHLRAYGEEELVSMVGGMLQEKGLLKDGASPFARAFIAMVSNMLELVTDAEPELTSVLSYPLEETVASEGCKSIVEDNLKELAEVVLAKYDSGELVTTIEEGGMKKWIKALGKEMGIKGKRLFMPLRVALTGKMAGPDIGEQLSVLALEDGDVNQDVVRLPERMEKLRLWVGSQ